MPRFPIYNPNSDPFKYEPQVGMKFANPKELKFSLICYAVANGKNIRFSRSAHYKLEVKCVKGCPWRIWASWMQREKSFQIKSYRNTHRCVRVFKIKLANARFWGKAFCKELMIDPKMKPLAIRQQILRRHYVDITPNQAYKVKSFAMCEVDTTLIEHYKKVRNYGEELLKSNPGSTVSITTTRPEGENGPFYFQRFY
ncbi:Mudr family transposase, partial [Thalictrum thalictroides]